jgi:hypothetical protein
VALAVSPVLWAKHQPDRFDIYSAGLVLMQLAVPRLRSEAGLAAFAKGMKRVGYDLDALRASTPHLLGAAKNDVLDADGGAGWRLASAMLRKRVLEVGRCVHKGKCRCLSHFTTTANQHDIACDVKGC